MAIHPAAGKPVQLRKVAAATGNQLDEPHVEIIPVGGSTESIGFGGMQVSINIEMQAATGAGEQIVMEIAPTADMVGATIPVNYGDIPCENLPNKGLIQQASLEGLRGYFRIRNTSTVPIKVDYVFVPNNR